MGSRTSLLHDIYIYIRIKMAKTKQNKTKINKHLLFSVYFKKGLKWWREKKNILKKKNIIVIILTKYFTVKAVLVKVTLKLIYK